MNCNHRNLLKNTTLKFPRTGFWMMHVLGAMFLVLFGMRLAVRKASIPIIAYRLFKRLQ